MAQGIDQLARLTSTIDLPGAWASLDADDAIGTVGRTGVPARLGVDIVPSEQSVEEIALDLMVGLRAAGDDLLVVNADIWPHPTWGVGRLVQSAQVRDGLTMAHDVYLFAAHGRRLRVDVTCALMDLLELEESVATIVARLPRPVR